MTTACVFGLKVKTLAVDCSECHSLLNLDESLQNKTGKRKLQVTRDWLLHFKCTTKIQSHFIHSMRPEISRCFRSSGIRSAYCDGGSGRSGLRSWHIISDSMRLQSAAYGFRSIACCRANALPSAPARSKSSLASSLRPVRRNSSPRCTRAWQAARPVPPLKEMAWSRSSMAPERNTAIHPSAPHFKA